MTDRPNGGERVSPELMSAAEIAEMLDQHRPTPEQTQVIEAPLSPMLVVAGAGSGKTETMSARVVYLIANKLVEPHEVLGLTFTRKAAGELAERVSKRLRQLRRARSSVGGSALDALDRPTISTYNSYAASLVSDHGLRIGREPGARLLSEASSWQVASDVVESWHADLATDAAVSTVVAAVLDLSNALSEHLLSVEAARSGIDALLADIEATPFGGKRTGLHADVVKLAQSLAERRRLLDVVETFQDRKRAMDAVDFGDQVALAARLAEEVEAVAPGERDRFKVVLLDEYQDTSYAQIRLLSSLFGAGHPVTAVGDPNQSIYGWRGASASGPARFPSQFRDADGTPARVHRLSTSWRNDLAVLEVANTTSSPLYAADPENSLPSLEARPAAGLGSVHAVYTPTVEEEGAAIAEFIVKRWKPGVATAAVLCRARSQFPVIEAALRMRGLPVEVVGLGGLLTTPEVVDLVALLEVVHDPSRGDSLMRLLTGPRLNLGAADLHALGSRSKELARRRTAHGVHGAGGAVEGDSSDERSIVDAIDDLPGADWHAPDGRSFTPEGGKRLRELATMLRELRALTYLSIPELVDRAERALGLDIEVALLAAAGWEGSPDRPTSDPRGRAHLDAFRDVAVHFANTSDLATLGAFLAWLTMAEKRERGLDRPANAPDPKAVQLITVHASKGLEWDVVAVPGLVDGVFPSTKANGAKGPVSSGWLTGLGALPFPLRGDAADLPELNLAGADDSAELNTRLTDFRESCGEHEVFEERRLAYVAFTRARSDLLLTGAWWRTAQKPTTPSLFLTELHDADVLAEFTVADAPPADATNPRDDLTRQADWPAGPEPLLGDGEAPAPLVAVLRRSADLVARALNSPGGASADEPDVDRSAGVAVLGRDGTDLSELSEILLTERASRGSSATSMAFPAHISASGLVEIALDRDAYALSLRRPIPREPSVHSRRGTAFHLWVERFYGSTSLFDLDDMPGADDERMDADQTLDDLRRTFERSPWAALQPIAVEVAIDTVVAGVITRTRIDAVFPDSERPASAGPGVVVVDWKTGRSPSDPEAMRAREVQLAVYRIAWSQWAKVPLEDVSAAFYYVGDDRTVRPTDLAGLADLERLIVGEPRVG
ncbi:DNA helicase-2 / ATP-dependent DNA helicase PcrA [Sanguibacter gelidistatuariae]|uniref:DNA 3'-5' helicase n=1 Tax=Sanguibacter gelidistatuariae TaxID=1814289 RepID=A0A1G6L1G1_9MICO|nr:ATP-dependent DNA helicase [Sanguibacter gelidistatuariae]SDC37209.1 DNA helicase-2 / ATP-dependent DNA helicase PcrA [Sanguibacter gelidistatuariae]